MDTPSVFAHMLRTDDVLNGIIAAFDQNIWINGFHKAYGRVFFKHDDRAYLFKGSHDDAACFFRLYGARRSLQAFNGGI